jgi:hypothetical protein
VTSDPHGRDGEPSPDDEPEDEEPRSAEPSAGVTIEGFDAPAETPSVNDGWHDLPEGADAFTPDEMIPDRTFLISEFLPDRDDPGIHYAEPGSEDPESPKARMRRELVERNREVYEGSEPGE